MKKQITELRIRIDGLAQLVKSLQNQGVLLIDETTIPPDMTREDVVKALSEHTIITKVKYEEIKPSHPNLILFSCYQSLLLGKAWLGKALASLCPESPYIEPAADTHPEIVGESDKTYIQKIDWLREEIKDIVKECDELQFTDLPDDVEIVDRFIDLFDWIHKHLSEARFHLGFELQRIKESK
jgi:hypothetical protein